ncbi:LacI family DNA-binding transcriptional regulator [Azotobacter beijerinckii]|uniref:LacI family DNA-binding transcriptional regulator n=1 Tax=Azotobacter beijerinckii TaxID=170623 RepID=UPI002952F455|nr:LacI family DNA-binding transcriptional regulator [Azotobacter beijerinckii]MDV7211680.1 LacI family DNA-binding transcriptional regulator [Azotobacter beijerinckii]
MLENSPDFSHASLLDVARRAGVSTATVSRVLNGTATVREAKRKAVERACEELGYVLNGAARTLSSRRSMTIGAVVPTLATETFSRPLAAFQRTVHQAGYTLLLANSGFDPQVELKEVTTLLEHGVDALMVVGQIHDPKLWERIERKGIPCVQTWSLDAAHPSVGFDNIAVARQVADHLIALGHTRIAMIVGTPPSNDRVSGRIVGTRERLAEARLELRPDWLIDSAFSLDEARESMLRLLIGDDRPTAVICGNDLLAFGALLAANASGLRVPEDLSIAGFNDFDYAAHLSPPLTTVRVALDQMGECAGGYLLGELTGRPGVRLTYIDTELIVRGSTGPAP